MKRESQNLEQIIFSFYIYTSQGKLDFVASTLSAAVFIGFLINHSTDHFVTLKLVVLGIHQGVNWAYFLY